MKRALLAVPYLLMMVACVHAQQGKLGGTGGTGGTAGWQGSVPPLVITTPALVAGQVGTAYSQTLTATGGASPYSWTVLLGSLPPGLTLNSSSGAITGTPTTAGAYAFSILVTDSTSPTNLTSTTSFNIVIGCPSLSITSTSPLPPGTISTAYSFQFISAGGLAPVTWSATGVPAGLSLSSAGALTGTPSGSGQSTITVTATDSCTTSAQSVFSDFSLTVNSSVVIQTTSPLPGGTQGVAYSTQLAAAGGTSPYTWTLASGSLPGGLSLSSAGIISGTPTTSGIFVFKISVADSGASTNSAIFTLTVTCPALSITSSGTLPGATQGVAYSDQLFSSGGVSPITWTVQSGSVLPNGLTLSSGGLLSGTPTLGGSYAFTVAASDSCSSIQTATLDATLTVTSSLQIVTTSLPAGTEGQPYNFQAQATGGSPPYSWTVPGGNIPNGAEDILDYAAMPVSTRYTSHLGATGLYKSFRLDAGLLWWVKNSQGFPWDGEAYDGSYVSQWFTEMDPSQNANCVAAGFSNCFNDPKAYKKYRTPVNLWARYHVPGGDDVVYTPGPNVYDLTVNCGLDNQPGIDNLGVRGELTGPFTNITWQTTYGGNIPDNTPYLLAQKWIKCTSNAVGSACPTEEDYYLVKGYGQVRWCPKSWNGSSYVTGTCTTQTQVAAGAATPNFACTVPATNAANGLPAGVPLAVSPSLDMSDQTGIISGVPAVAGTFTPIIQVEDSTGLIAQQSMSLTISCPAFSIATTSPLPNGTQNVPYSVQLQFSGGIAPVIWNASGTLPTGVTLSSGGLLSGTPTNFGSFLLGVTATDSCAGPGPNARQTVLALTIAQSTGAVAISTTSPLPNGTQGLAYTTQLSATGGTGPYTWSITVGHLPPGLTLNASTGVISGTPTAAEVDTPTFKVTDSLGANTSKVLSITTTCPSLSMVSTSPLPGGQQSSPYSFQFQASGGITPYTWTQTGGTLPTGVTLATTGSLAGTPSNSGSFSPTIRVADSCAPTPQTASSTFSLTISASPIPVVINTTSPLPAGTVGIAYSQALSASGGTGPYTWTITSGALPAGLSLSSAGVISGTPTTSQTTTPTIKATDSLGANASKAFSITISCTPLAITSTSPLPNGTQSSPYSFQFTKTGGQGSVTWGATGVPTGLSLSSSGLLNGTPSGSGTSTLSVTATDSCSTPQSANGSFSLTVTAAPNPLAITTASPLPSATQNQVYNITLSATGGTPPYGSWTVTVGTLPTGLSLNSSTGVISGTPTVLGTSAFTVRVTDNVAATATKALSLTVNALGTDDSRYCTAGNTVIGVLKDGPANPIAACVNTAIANTPSPGSTINVTAGSCASLQSAFSTATAGQTIVIPALNGAAQDVFTACPVTTGNNGTATNWITVKTSALSSLPPEGSRVSPAYIGVTSLHIPCPTGSVGTECGRPAYSQPGSAGVYMPKIVSNGPTIILTKNFWRFIGLEVTTTSGVNTSQVIQQNANAITNIIFDRMVVHGGNSATGQDRDNIQAAIRFSACSYCAVINSYLYDTHCIANGTCSDSQGVFIGGSTAFLDGPIKVVNNFIETSGEGILSGGGGQGAATLPASDLEIRTNHFFKPLFWKSNDAAYFGTNFLVKNHLEFKNSARALIEGNIFDQLWAFQSDQQGVAIIFGARNQNAGTSGMASSNGSGLLTASSGTFNPKVVDPNCATPSHCLVKYANANYLAQTWTSSTTITVSPNPPANASAAFFAFIPGLNPSANVVDVTFRYNRISHTSRGFEIAAVKSDGGDISLGGSNFSIHDIVGDDIVGSKWSLAGGCCFWGDGFQLASFQDSPRELHDITIRHVTLLPTLSAGTPGPGGPVFGFGAQSTANGAILRLKIYDSISAGGLTSGNTAVCAANSSATALLQCWDKLAGVPQNTFCFDHNALSIQTTGAILGTGNNPPYPQNSGANSSPGCGFSLTGTASPANYTSFQFNNLNGANGGDYTLQGGSPYHNAASDGTDLGANIGLVNQYTAGAQ